MNPASRTPEGASNRCPVCGHRCRMEPSSGSRDAPCPSCGSLLWFRSEKHVPVLFSTTEAARICRISKTTMRRCIDSGQLKGLDGGRIGRLRIPQDSLRTFMEENGIPTDELDAALR